MEDIQKLTKIVENYFRETKIRSFRATKINRNQGLIFKDNYCQIRSTYYARTSAILYQIYYFYPHLVNYHAFFSQKSHYSLPNLIFFLHIW